MAKKYVYAFAEGNADMRDLLGGKGANLAEMTGLGLPVPPGFIITTEACNDYNAGGQSLPDGLWAEVQQHLTTLEKDAGKTFGDKQNPLLVSVRSGAKFSMPGMMDTVLNLGLNDETVQGLAAATGNARFAWDCYRRFIQMFGNVVLRLDHGQFEQMFERRKQAAGATHDYEIPAETLQQVVADYKAYVKEESRESFPQDPVTQLRLAVEAVFNSWMNPRAVIYRQLHSIPDNLGTAVSIVAMVYGNLGSDSGTGVVFTRDPNTGNRELYGEYLINAQGEDVVAGIRTPQPIAQLQAEAPEVYRQLHEMGAMLEKHYADMQDIEFTVERGRLYILQTRAGKRTAQAAIQIAVDLVHEGLIDRPTALQRVEPDQLEKILHRGIDASAEFDVLAKGLPASPGAATGKVVFDADRAEQLARDGDKVLLVRPETTPDDIHGMIAAEGILTSRGGMTCHAAIVARGMGKPCIVGCESLKIDLARGELSSGGRTFREGDTITIDGASGQVIIGTVPLVEPELSGAFTELLSWADAERRLGVRANADTETDAAKAREFGAEGIGLCRTEHMFMAQDRLPIVQEMILAETEHERREALDKLLPLQRSDFAALFRAMDGLPVTIRLLDPPLHEFLPDQEELAVEVALLRERVAAQAPNPEMPASGPDVERLADRERLLRQVRALAEFNPMLGFRGCRLGLVFPEIYEMQARAIFEAAAEVVGAGGRVVPEVMIPLVGHVNELRPLRQLVVDTAAAVQSERGAELTYIVGTMIEVPRACITADEIAEEAEFFSFGTNDLTQTAFGFSRDDAEGKFLHHYIQHKVLEENPFVSLDQGGVGKLVEMGTRLGRQVRSDLKVGICGEHGGDPATIHFLHDLGLDYVSCSPFRVPVARLAAAQAALAERAVLVKRDV